MGDNCTYCTRGNYRTHKMPSVTIIMTFLSTVKRIETELYKGGWGESIFLYGYLSSHCNEGGFKKNCVKWLFSFKASFAEYWSSMFILYPVY